MGGGEREDSSSFALKCEFPSHRISDKLADSVSDHRRPPLLSWFVKVTHDGDRDTCGEPGAPDSNLELTGFRPLPSHGRGLDSPNPCQGRAWTDPLPGKESCLGFLKSVRFLSTHLKKHLSGCFCVCSCSVVFNSSQPHGLSPARLLCPWNSPGKNTGVGCHSLLLGTFPTQGANCSLPHCRQILYHLSHQGSPDVSNISFYKHLLFLHLPMLSVLSIHLWGCHRRTGPVQSACGSCAICL